MKAAEVASSVAKVSEAVWITVIAAIMPGLRSAVTITTTTSTTAVAIGSSGMVYGSGSTAPTTTLITIAGGCACGQSIQEARIGGGAITIALATNKPAPIKK